MDVIADYVKVIIEAELNKARADVKAYGEQFNKTTTQLERDADRQAKAAERAAQRVAKAQEQQAAAAEAAARKAAERAERTRLKAEENTARKLASQRRIQAQTVQQTVGDIISQAGSVSGPGDILRILSQQGPQVIDRFGGINNVLKELKPLAFSAGGALTGMGLALAAAVVAADRFDASNKQLLVSTTGLGVRAGLTVGQLKDLAAANAEAGNVSRAAAESMVQSYISTGRIGAEVTGKLIAITDDYSRATGIDAKKATEVLGKAFSDPVKGAQFLGQQFGFLDAETYRLIQQMVAAGDTMGAQKLLADKLSGALAGQADNVSFLTKLWRGLKGAISDAATATRDFATAQPGAGNARTGGARGAADRALAAAGQAAQTAGQRARNDRGVAGQQAIDEALGNDRRTAISSEISKIQAAVKDGTVNAKDASKAIKKLKEDMQSIGAGPKAPKPTKAEEREAIARAEGRVAGPAAFGNDSKYGTGLNTDTVSASDLEELQRIFISKGGLEEFIRSGGPNFVAAGTGAVSDASDAVKDLNDQLYNGTYNSIKGGLEAAFNDGVPGVAEFLGNELKRALIEDVSALLTNIVRGRDPGYGRGGDDGTLGSALLARGKKLFGRAVGGNMVAGVPYQVNEGRPEVFVPPQSGKMVPASRLARSGRSTVNQTLIQDFSGSFVAETALAAANRYADNAAKSARIGATRDSLRMTPAAVAKSQKQRG